MEYKHIIVNPETKERLEKLMTKKDTYDKIIKGLISFWVENHDY